MGAKMAARDNAPTARLIDRLAPSSGARLKPGQSGELAADLVEGCGGNRGSPIADRMGQRVDAAHVAGQDLPGNGQPRRQHDAGAERADTGGDRTNDRAALVGSPIEGLSHRLRRHALQQLGEHVTPPRRRDDDPVTLDLDIDAGTLAQPHPLCDIFRNAQPEAVSPTRDAHLHRTLRPARWIYLGYLTSAVELRAKGPTFALPG